MAATPIGTWIVVSGAATFTSSRWRAWPSPPLPEFALEPATASQGSPVATISDRTPTERLARLAPKP